MADRLKVTELDFDTIKANLKNFLRQQSEFQDYDFEGSGLNVMLDILAYNTHYNSYYLNMIANESFLDSALLRNSVVSHAKRMGYVPRSNRASRAIVNLNIQSDNSLPEGLTLPRGFTFLSNQLDGRSYKFITLEDYTVQKTANSFNFTNIPIYEGELNSFSYINSIASNPKQIFDIPDVNVDTSTLRVFSTPTNSNTDITVYNLSEDPLTVKSTEEVYYLQEGQDGKYQIYFGNGVFGKALPDGAVLNIQYLVCNASAPNSSNNFVSSSSLSGYTSIVITSVSAASGGIERETVDEIKFSAPLQNLSRNRAVTKNDYITLIQQKYPFFEAVNVWGGEDNDPPIYGKVFVCAKPVLGFEVTDTIKEEVKNNVLKPMSVLTVTPEIVDVDYNYLKIICDVYYSPSKTTLSASGLQTTVKNVILNYAQKNLDQFNSYFNYNGLESSIQNSNKAVISNEVDLYVGKKFRPDLINPNNYILDYGFELQRGTTTESFYSTPDFKIFDEQLIERNCFFEEVPSSFSGIESITVINPGYNYTSIPTVTIIGDGSGAKANAVIVNGKVSEIIVTNPGIGYTIATVRITGGGGKLATASAVLEGRYGKLRIAYYRPDAITSEQTKVILNQNSNNGIIGDIDYVLGKITIRNFNPIDVNNDFNDITIYMKPNSSIIQSKLNKMLVLDASDASSVVVKPIAIAS